MVKPDVKVDYYADLDLPPNADAEDIKRQFRTLGEYIPKRLMDIS
jgi:DnaJ-class molecular chaperone